MAIAVFQNRRQSLLALTIEPCGERHELPHLGEIGIRYTLTEGAEDRCYASVSDEGVDFWCNAESFEVDIVQPSARDKLLWDICVNGGWCGGLVNGQPTSVDDLLPTEGRVTAEEFARLAIRADGWPEGKPMVERHRRWLEERFREHLGADSVSAEALHRLSPRPFGDAAS